ncbi:MAG: CHAT domain-containing protein, partial [Arenimonas sp.]
MNIRIISIPLLLTWLILGTTVFASEAGNWDELIAQGVQYRLQGNLTQAVDVLVQASEKAQGSQKARASGELGATLILAHRYDEAEAPLLLAYHFFSGPERSVYALDLGNLSVAKKDIDQARRYYTEAVNTSAGNSSIEVSAELNLAKIASDATHLSQLVAIEPKLAKIPDSLQRARFALNLGNQARKLIPAVGALPLAYRNLENARLLLQGSNKLRQQAETLDSLAQLYEDEHRAKDALSLSQQAIEMVNQLPQSEAGDLPVNLEWRIGRLSKELGQPHQALAAYQRAVSNIESVRRDMPIEYEDGQSSFRMTLEPIYTGLIDLLLQQAHALPIQERSSLLKRAIETTELIKQSEMQDYLGDRCIIDGVRNESTGGVEEGVALLYPIIMQDRIELLLKTNAGITLQTMPINNELVRHTAKVFASRLREGAPNFLTTSQKLYDWLIRPFDETLLEAKIRTLVVVPDSVLRLVPMAALNDGENYLVEKFAVSTVAGISMTNTQPAANENVLSLVAGMSKPGSVMDKLSGELVAQITNAATLSDSPELAMRGLASE